MNHPMIFAPMSPTASDAIDGLAAAGPSRASPDAVRRFEQLIYSPMQAAPPGALMTSSTAAGSGIQSYLQQLSQRWEAGQTAVRKMLADGKYTSSELVLTQIQMMNCALDVELSSKCASIFENGVQTLVQRGGA